MKGHPPQWQVISLGRGPGSWHGAHPACESLSTSKPTQQSQYNSHSLLVKIQKLNRKAPNCFLQLPLLVTQTCRLRGELQSLHPTFTLKGWVLNNLRPRQRMVTKER